MIEDAQRIFDYLPLEFKTQAESDYVTFLWDAFSVNYEKEKYQFAYIAYHMLFMCFVYFQLAKIYFNRSEEIKKLMIFTGKAQSAIDNYEKKVEEAAKKKLPPPHFNPFSLADEHERSILGLFISIGCNRETIKRMKGIVDERNDIAHSNGNINFSNQYIIDEKIGEILSCIESIQKNSAQTITTCAEKFFTDNANPEEREFFEEENQVREIFVRGNYLSTNDIITVKDFGFENVKVGSDYSSADKLYWTLISLYPTDNDEMDWETDARKAVEQAMEFAEWNEETKSITFRDRNEHRNSTTVSTQEELEYHLVECASIAFHGSVPWEDGEAVFDFEAEDVVQRVLFDYQEKLKIFFADRPQDESTEGE